MSMDVTDNDDKSQVRFGIESRAKRGLKPED